MATQAEESTSTPRPPAQVVGNAFVEQYYNMLSKSPENVHKFYQNSSVISRPDSDGLMSSVSTLDGIDKMILSVDYKNYVVEILTTDAQESFGDGVIVLVTGFFTGKDNIRRKFAQVFFLEPQGHSYYVLNDVLRYVGEEEVASININDGDDTTPTAPETPDSEPTLVSDNSVHDNVIASLEEDTVQAEESSHPLDNGNISTVDEEAVSIHSVGTTQSDGNPVSAGTEQSDALPVSDVVASTVQEDAPKKSYASVANALNYKKQPFQQRVLPAKPVKQFQAPVVATVAPEVLPPPANNKFLDKNNSQVKGYSIFVANLPMNATVEQLKETFEKFGPIKPNGVQVRSYKQEKNCFGFVEFESANSMQSALEVSSIEIGGRQAHIEEKKANTEGSKPPPRKTGSRGDNYRNRGNSGGRGYGRNEFDNQDGLSGQSRGTSRRNGEGNQKVYQNGGGRAPRQGPGQGEGQAQAEGGKN
ncbi:nuclear transport factor 2 [Ricinus communis]|uniref:nuclear transport factor 2 n=1 Tax=Ricinus communis TaxID=3988 RepID=UPI00201ADDF1|nr:nuclear transport factor 2 [Ricinus communis]